MPLLSPHQILIASFELLLLLGGVVWWVMYAAGAPSARKLALGQNRIAPWAVTGAEATLLFITIFLCGLVGQGLAVHFLGEAVRSTGDRAGLEVVLFGVGFHGAALLGWPLFAQLRRWSLSSYGVREPVRPAAKNSSLFPALKHGALALALMLPAITATSIGWTALLRAIGLPDAPQDLIAIFGAVKSPFVLVAMLFVACVLAPINEELVFRGLIFRFCRQRFGRGIALVLSASAFGALHGNWAGFLPLAVLGAGLALAYEYTGDIRVPIVGHALFNLNTILVIVADLPQA